MPDPVLVLDSLSVGYGAVSVRSNMNFCFSKGECVLLAGANGCGKSTLLRTIAEETRPLSGSVSIEGTCTLVPSRVPKVPGFTVREFMRLSLSDRSGIFTSDPPGLSADIDSALSDLGIVHLADKDISRISDGEFQKACIAAALSRGSDIILLDEPTAYLDVQNRISVLEALASICHEKGKCVIYSSHDVLDSLPVADKVLVLMDDGSCCLSDSTMRKKSLLLQSCFPKLVIPE